MNVRIRKALSVAVVVGAVAGVTLLAQTQMVPDTVAGHVAAAKAAGGTMWPSLVKQLCTPAEEAPAPPAARGAQPPPPQGPPARSTWYHEPLHVFDNMWLFPTADVGAWAVKTSAGIIMLDTTYGYSVKELIADNMVKVGLNPADIKAIFVTHGHGDHFGGVKYLQELYNPRVFISTEDWDSMLKPPANPNPNPAQQNLNPVPKKDGIATDGMKYTLGDTTITVVKTPGHTEGTISFLIPVKLNGQPHVAAMWGGTALSRGTGIPHLTMYSASAKKFAKIAADAKADIMLSNHERFGEANRLMGLRKANPTGPDPFVRGIDGIQRYTQVLDQCAQAIVVALRAAPPATMN